MSSKCLICIVFLSLVALSACQQEAVKEPLPPAPASAPAVDHKAGGDPAPQEKQARQCQKDKGCAPAQALPACAPGLTITPLAQALENRNPIKSGTVISVQGPLTSAVGCTEMGCPADFPCCNRCNGDLRLGPEPGAPRVGYTSLALVDEKDPARFRCEGDDTLSCCPFEAKGQAVVATGEFGSFNGDFGLKNVTLCAP